MIQSSCSEDYWLFLKARNIYHILAVPTRGTEGEQVPDRFFETK